MTTIDEERRDIAEYLKHLSRFSRCRYKEEFFDLLAERVTDWYGNSSDFCSVFERLSELIDPENIGVPSQPEMAKAERLRELASVPSYELVPMRPSELMEIAEMLERGGRDD